MNTRVCAVSFYKLKHLELQSWNRKILITHNHFRHCRVRFSFLVRQPFPEIAVYITDSFSVRLPNVDKIKCFADFFFSFCHQKMES